MSVEQDKVVEQIKHHQSKVAEDRQAELDAARRVRHLQDSLRHPVTGKLPSDVQK